MTDIVQDRKEILLAVSQQFPASAAEQVQRAAVFTAFVEKGEVPATVLPADVIAAFMKILNDANDGLQHMGNPTELQNDLNAIAETVAAIRSAYNF